MRANASVECTGLWCGANRTAHLLPSLEKQMVVGWGGVGKQGGGSESSTGQGVMGREEARERGR